MTEKEAYGQAYQNGYQKGLEDGKPKWIPVTERLPEHFQPVLICREKEYGKLHVEQGYKDVGRWWKVYGTRITRVLYWMPLPEPPKGD